MQAKVLKPVNINETPAKVGDIVEVCENTFRNLVKKGKLGPVTEDDKPEEATSKKGSKK